MSKNEQKNVVSVENSPKTLNKRGSFFAADPELDLMKKPFWASLVAFLIGIVGFQIIGTIMSLVLTGIITADNPGLSASELIRTIAEYSVTAEGLAIVNFPSYAITLGIMAAILFKQFKPCFRSFAKLKPYVMGAIGGIAMIVFSIFWGILGNIIFGDSGTSENQIRVVSMVSTYPLLSVLCIGLIGPFMEEVAYRYGLFDLVKRANRILAYIATAVVFGLIHFGWETIGTDGILKELFNLVDYAAGGLALSFLYDRYGFASSFSAHALNNLTSIVLVIIGD